MLNNALFSLEEIAEIKNSSEEKTKVLLGEVIKEADVELEKEVSDMETLGFAYYITEDEKYFIKAKSVMEYLCKMDAWTPPPKTHGGFAGTCELGSASKAVNSAYFFNLFGDKLSSEEKEYIFKNTWEKGINPIFKEWVLPVTRLHSIDTMGHNWWCVMISSACLAATLFKDYIKDFEYTVNYGIRALKEWFEYKGNKVNTKPVNFDCGGFYEGIAYINYSLFEYLRFAIAYKRTFDKSPLDDESLLNKMAEFILNCYYPSSEDEYFVNFGDASKTATPDSPIYMLRYGLGIKELRYYLNRRRKNGDSKVTLLLIQNELKKEEKIPETLNVCYGKIGWAIMRNSYLENSTMLAVKCGDTWNHAHADAGHFSLYRKGRAEIYDSGNPSSYTKEVYRTYYAQSIAHNVVLFNNMGQDSRDNLKDHARVKGRLLNFKADENFKYLLADCTGPMGRYFRKHHRHFLWIENAILIYDDIECYEKGEVNFLMHEDESSFKMLTDCECTVREGCILCCLLCCTLQKKQWLNHCPQQPYKSKYNICCSTIICKC